MKTGEAKRNTEIQNLRAIAAICIMIGHMPLALPGILIHGYSFVSLFLVFTGFFAARQFRKKYSESVSSLTVMKKELVAKCFRLAPLMWIWILIYFFIGNLVNYLGGSYGDPARWCSELKAALLLYYNYYLAGLSIGGLFGQYWTLFVEIHFYVLFVFLFLLVRKDRYRRYLSLAIVLLTIFVFRPLTAKNMIRYSTQAHLDSLFAGVFIGLLDGKQKPAENHGKLLHPFVGTILVTALYLSAYFFDTYGVSGSIKYTVYMLNASLILLLAEKNVGYFSYGKVADRILLRIGNASASIYVCHVILFSCVYYNIYANTTLIPEVLKFTDWGVCLQVVFLVLLACVMGHISYCLIEKPYIRYSKELVERIA